MSIENIKDIKKSPLVLFSILYLVLFLVYYLFSDTISKILPHRLTGIIGFFFILLTAYSFSVNKEKIRWKTVGWGLSLQLIFALLVLKTKPGALFFQWVNDVIKKLLDFTVEGTAFVFSEPIVKHFKIGFIFAIHVLPTIIFFASFMAVLYYLGIMQGIINFIAKIMVKTMDTSGSESLSASANIFVGQTEAPLVIKPFIATMTRSEIMAIMTGGMATVAGGVLAAYVGILSPYFPDIAGHLMAASIMAAPAGLLLAKTIIPETEESNTKGELKLKIEKTDSNVIEALSNGAAQGVQLAINVAAMLIAFLAMVALINYLLLITTQFLHHYLSFIPVLDLAKVFGFIFSPISWAIGVPIKDAAAIGNLLGEKIVLNEFVSYSDLGKILQTNNLPIDVVLGSISTGLPITPHIASSALYLHKKSILIASYALCGFANFASIGIQLGGIGPLAPNKKSVLAELGPYALLAGILATSLTATIAGILD